MKQSESQNLPYDVEKEIHLLDYLHVIQRRWRIALIIFLLVFVGVAIKTSMQTPLYRADVTMRLGYKPDTASLLNVALDNRGVGNAPSPESEMQILLSWDVAEKAAAELNYDWVVDDDASIHDLYIRKMIVPDQVTALAVELTGFVLSDGSESGIPVGSVEKSARYILRSDDGTELGTGLSGQLLDLGDLKLQLDFHGGRVGETILLTKIPLDEAVGRTMAGASAHEVGEYGDMLGLSVEHPDPVSARDIANALARAYQQKNAENKAQEAGLMLGFIDEHLKELSGQLDRSEQALQEFTITTGLKRLSPEGTTLVSAAVELERKRAEYSLQKQRLQVFMRNANHTNDFSALSGIPGVEQYINRLFELQARRNELLRMYTSSHPAVAEVREEITQTRASIIGLAEQTLRRLRIQIADIEKELQESGKKLEEVPEEEYELVRLTRANQVNAELYSYLLQRQQETRIAEAATVSDVEVINWAQLPAAPVKPNKRKNLALGLILGLMLGIGTTFLLDYIDRTIKDEDDVQEKLGLTVLGTIPKIPIGDNGESKQLITQLEPLSPASEAFLALRTNLLYVLTNQKHRTVMLTSCLPDEGKSTIAVNLATTLAQTGAKTLLVGCDLRRPSLFDALDQTEAPGLTDLLMNRDRKAIRRIEGLGLDFVPAGTEPPNPSQVLNSELMRSLLARARERYDYVILDVPPLLPVADALVLASQVDLNIMVIESCRIPEKIAKRALKSLYHHSAEIGGVVLNDKSGRGAKYYGAYSYYEGKYYQGYYRRGEAEPEVQGWRRALEKIWNFING